MNPLDEIQQLINATRTQSASLRRQEQELREQHERPAQRERAEPTLQFADIRQISQQEMNNTKASFQSGIWIILQHHQEWMVKIRNKGIQHPKDIKVERAIIEAEFRDEKILKRMMEQLEESRTGPQFRQVGQLGMVHELYLKKGYFNHALQASVGMGSVTPENAPEMLRIALDKARIKAEAKIERTAEMKLQTAQDEWWRTLLNSLQTEDKEAKPIIVMQVNIMIKKWQQHLKEEMEVVIMRQQL